VIRDDESHAQSLRLLRGMGFNDTPLNRFLLLNNNGDIQRVVEFLLSRKAN